MNIIIPNKTPNGAIRLSELNNWDRQARVWKNVVQNDKLLATHIRTGQRTLRLMGIIPTWENFMQTRYFHMMIGVLDPEELRKYRAWWETIWEISDGKDLDRGRAFFMLALLVRERLRRVYAKEMEIKPEKYGIRPEDEERLKDAILSRFEDLTRF